MKLFHTSPTKIEKINKDGLFGDVLFFSCSIYTMTAKDYVVYSLDARENDFIDVEDLDDSEGIEDIMRVCDCDEETAIEYLNGEDSPEDYEEDFYVQQVQAESAKRAGFLGATGQDEQGTVFMISMFGKEDLLKPLN